MRNVPAHALAQDLGQPLANDVLVCADDEEAAASVVALVEAAGMTSYYAGGFDNGLAVETLTALIIRMIRHYRSKSGAIRVTGIRKSHAALDCD